MVDLNKARRAFKDFTGHDATKGYETRLDDKAVTGYRMGQVVGIAYRAKRDGKSDQYFHRFKEAARPDLVSRDDGKQLYITGGKYRVTERGIEDKKTMPALYVVNPSKRRKRRASTSRRRVAVYTSNPRRRASPKRRRRSVSRFRRNPVTVVARSNPTRRRRRSVSRFRRNPSALGGGKGNIKIMSLLMPAVMAGAGAVGAEIVMGYLPIPANFKSGILRHVTKGAVGIALGMLAGRFVSRRLGESLAVGAITVATHDSIKDGIAKAAPNVRFGEYIGSPGIGEYMGSTGIGYYSAGQPINAASFRGSDPMEPVNIMHAGD